MTYPNSRSDEWHPLRAVTRPSRAEAEASAARPRSPCAGARLRPTIGSAFNATLISYGPSCDIGVNIDTAAVSDPEVLVECLQEGFDEIVALGGAEA